MFIEHGLKLPTDPVLQQLAKRIAHIDCLSCRAEAAICTAMCDSRPIDEYVHQRSQHPVIEQNLPSGEAFVPNDLAFTDDRRLIMLTGPNMAGKSTI